MSKESTKNTKVVGRVLLPSLLINLLSLAVPLTVLQIYDRILPNQSYGTATLLLAGAALAVGMEALIRFVRSWLLAAAASNTEKATFEGIITRLSSASPLDILRLGLGGVEQGLSAIPKLKEWYSGGVIAGFIDLPFALIFLSLVAYIGGELVFIPVAVWLLTLSIVWVSSFRVKQLSEEASLAEQQRKAFLILMAQTIQGIKRQAIESRIFSQFKRLNHSRSLSKASEETQNAFAQECIQLAALATSVALVVVGSLWVLDGELTTGGLAACSILSGRAVAPLSALVGVRIKLNSIHSAQQAINELEQIESNTVPIIKESQVLVNQIQFRSINIDRFGIGYTLDLTAAQGDCIILDSEDRHINSHMLSCLSGVDVWRSGSAYIDTSNVSSREVSELSRHTAYCSVKAQLIAGTLLDNMCGFNPSCSERANHYAQQLGLHDQIMRLPDGLETKVGQTSTSLLSMGNTKLLNIITQLSNSKPILFLDRPDASLDLDALEKLAHVLQQEKSRGRLIIMVTYHPALRALASKVVSITRELDKQEHVA
ncbi:ABC transporter ATP-binding protein [Vibrio sp. ZSDE26]|uniref:ABC transporter ATP-binding protein n=1 Tax=Vibrio amylolyticus TaxID=2847292 RepID=A0A9X1XQK1_9VIBR|nr:ABC transporter ATP-binding protein [Vibrio amylolyticus]MCK6263724.1 ABC transporter ATP-binding protein [Vibrio amylolyticus]